MKAIFALLLLIGAALAVPAPVGLGAGAITSGVAQSGAVIPIHGGALLVPPSDVGTVIAGPDGNTLVGHSWLLG